MIATHFLDVNLKQFVADNRASSRYYQPIQRTGDLLEDSTVFSKGSSSKLRSDVFIAPARIKVGSLPTQALNQLQHDLNLAQPPTPEDAIGMEISELIAEYKGEEPPEENTLKAELQQQGFTGEMIQAAQRLNQARLDPIDREILSRSNLATYAFYLAIIGLDVKDVDGIFSNVLGALTKIKRHLNQVLVDLVLDKHHLKATESDRAYLKKKVADQNFSYKEGEVSKALLDDYQQLRTGGELVETINEFLDSDLIKLPDNINREALIENMIDYLVDNGFNPDEIDFEDDADTDNSQVQDYVVTGFISDSAGQPLPGLRIRAVDEDFTGENLLGEETITDEQGLYRVPYSAQDFVIEGKELGGADIIIYVTNAAGEQIYKSQRHGNSPKSRVINIEIDASTTHPDGNTSDPSVPVG